MNLKGRSFLTLKDFTPEEIGGLLDLAAEYKEKKKKGIPVDTLRGKNVALIFGGCSRSGHGMHLSGPQKLSDREKGKY